ncbi:MAG: sigma-70 family RNA polymerase sigma factor [Terracidiphilus sp.]|jgi:RNA polymerase sigma-70 factor (ECF subfamily)
MLTSVPDPQRSNPGRHLQRTAVEDGNPAQGEKVETMDDAALLEAVAEGNQDAMAAVFDRYGRIVFCIALRVLREPSLAEDVMQEVLLQVWKRPQSFVAQRGNLAAWLSVVARNRAIDVLRKRSPLDPLGDLPLPDPRDMTVEHEQGWMLDKVRTAMDALPADQQGPLELAYFEGLSHTEIAERTGSPLGTVKTRIRAGLMTIRKAMTA